MSAILNDGLAGCEVFVLPEEQRKIAELLQQVQVDTGWPTAALLKRV